MYITQDRIIKTIIERTKEHFVWYKSKNMKG